jgi:hypothetical protein
MTGYFGRIGVFAYSISNCPKSFRFSNGFSNFKVGFNFTLLVFSLNNSRLLAET